MLTTGSTCTGSPPGCGTEAGGFSGCEPGGDAPDMETRRPLLYVLTGGTLSQIAGLAGEVKRGPGILYMFDTHQATRWVLFLFRQPENRAMVDSEPLIGWSGN